MSAAVKPRVTHSVVVVMDEHHSGCGTSGVTYVETSNGEKSMTGVMGAWPMSEFDLDTSAGRRFRITVEALPPSKKVKPRKNPFLECSARRADGKPCSEIGAKWTKLKDGSTRLRCERHRDEPDVA